MSAQQRAASAALASSVIAFAMLIVSGIALWFLKGTLEATRDAIRQADEGTKAALIAAEAGKKANEIAAASAAESHRLNQLEARAYITVRIDETVRLDDGSYRIIFHFENSGNTPAKNVISCFELKSLPYHPPPGTIFCARPIKQASLSIVRPNSHITLNQELPLIKASDVAIEGFWDYRFYLIGWILYDDVFGNAWETKYAFLIRPEIFIRALVKKENIPLSAFPSANQWNEIT